MRRSALAALALSAAALALPAALRSASPVCTVVRVADGDTVTLGNGQRVRLVQIDTPEVYFGVECYGRAASGWTKRLLPEGTRVRLLAEPATDRVDQYGRLLRYVIRVRDGLNVNVRLVAVGCRRAVLLQGAKGAATRPAWKCSPAERERSGSVSGDRARVLPTTRTREFKRAAEHSSDRTFLMRRPRPERPSSRTAGADVASTSAPVDVSVARRSDRLPGPYSRS